MSLPEIKYGINAKGVYSFQAILLKDIDALLDSQRLTNQETVFLVRSPKVGQTRKHCLPDKFP